MFCGLKQGALSSTVGVPYSLDGWMNGGMNRLLKIVGQLISTLNGPNYSHFSLYFSFLFLPLLLVSQPVVLCFHYSASDGINQPSNLLCLDC